MFAGILFVTYVSAIQAADVTVKGRISHKASGTQCLLQLRRPIWESAANDEEVRGDFSVRFIHVIVDETIIVNLTCGGYQVYTSQPLHLDQGENVLDVSKVDARTQLDSDHCRELTGLEGERASTELVAGFQAETHLPSSTLKLSRPRGCPASTILFVVFQGANAGAWDNWLVTKEKASGRISVEKGF